MEVESGTLGGEVVLERRLESMVVEGGITGQLLGGDGGGASWELFDLTEMLRDNLREGRLSGITRLRRGRRTLNVVASSA